MKIEDNITYIMSSEGEITEKITTPYDPEAMHDSAYYYKKAAKWAIISLILIALRIGLYYLQHI